MNLVFRLSRGHFSRILGGLLLCAAFVTLLLAPPKPAFSIANCLLFFSFVLTGAMLLWGLWGPAPIAVRPRRETCQAGPATGTTGCDVPERVFRYCPATSSWGSTLSVGLTTLLGLCLIGLGLFLAGGLPGSTSERFAMGLPLWIGGGISLWFPLRQRTMYVHVDANGLESRGYFRTVRLRWEDVAALIVRDYRLLSPFGFIPVGTVYSVYSQRTRLSFLATLPAAADLAHLISEATGQPWQ